METIALPRRPGQGVGNIVRFNWPFFAAALAGALGLAALSAALPRPWSLAASLALAGLAATTLGSLLVSAYIYDFSNLYHLDWLAGLVRVPTGHLVSVHAGFDEISALLAVRFPQARRTILDFYDPARHPEASIARARQAGPPTPALWPCAPRHCLCPAPRPIPC